MRITLAGIRPASARLPGLQLGKELRRHIYIVKARPISQIVKAECFCNTSQFFATSIAATPD
jgi:hypothetical protein